MGKNKTSVRETIEREFNGRTFTRFAVLTWCDEKNLEEWKQDFHEMVSSGVITEVERRPLGVVYKYQGDGMEPKHQG